MDNGEEEECSKEQESDQVMSETDVYPQWWIRGYGLQQRHKLET